MSNRGHKIILIAITAMCISSYITNATDIIPIRLLMNTLGRFHQAGILFFGKRHGPNGISWRYLLVEDEQGPIRDHF